MVCHSQNDTLTESSYNALGAVGIAIIFLIVVLSIVRSVYTGVVIKKEYGYKEGADKRHGRQAEVLRRD